MRIPTIRVTVRRFVVATAALAVYLATYRSLVYPDMFHGAPEHPRQCGSLYGGRPPIVSLLFGPANRIDRALRPSYWALPCCVY